MQRAQHECFARCISAGGILNTLLLQTWTAGGEPQNSIIKFVQVPLSLSLEGFWRYLVMIYIYFIIKRHRRTTDILYYKQDLYNVKSICTISVFPLRGFNKRHIIFGAVEEVVEIHLLVALVTNACFTGTRVVAFHTAQHINIIIYMCWYMCCNFMVCLSTWRKLGNCHDKIYVENYAHVWRCTGIICSKTHSVQYIIFL